MQTSSKTVPHTPVAPASPNQDSKCTYRSYAQNLLVRVPRSRITFRPLLCRSLISKQYKHNIAAVLILFIHPFYKLLILIWVKSELEELSPNLKDEEWVSQLPKADPTKHS